MKFINSGKDIRIRIGTTEECRWIPVKNGGEIDLPEGLGKRLGFKIKTTSGQIGNKTVETKQIETDKPRIKRDDILDFYKELQLINGIGKKTAQDISGIFTKEKLVEYITLEKHLPFRDDIEKLLRENFK